MTGAARSLCAVVVCAVVIGSLGVKSEKRSYRHGPSNGRRLPLPAVSPFRMDSATPSPSTLDPYACLPRYLCVVENKNGEKRTTIVHGLHPALRKAKPNVIDPSTLPNVQGGGSKPLLPPPFMTEDDDIYRDREFNDSFLQQQEMAEALAFLEEKRRQYMYQQGQKRPTQKLIPKGSKPPVTGSLEDKSDEESKEEEEEKSQEESKEEKDISAEASKEDEEKEEKDEPEPVDESEENASSEKQSQSRLSKYQLKKKIHSMKFKARNDESDESDDDAPHADMNEDRLVTVPWDDRLRNDTDPLKPSEIYDKLFGKVLPTFQLPSVSKIAKKLPGASFFTSSADEKTTTTTTTTTPKPGLLKRMIKAVTGGNSPTTRSERHHYRYKRDANDKLIAEEAKMVRQIRDPDRQCRMIFKGCDLPYDHIMKMVSSGKILIENDPEVRATTRRTYSQDDEADQAVKDKLNPKKSPKPIPQLLALQASLGGKKKVVNLPIFGKNKNKPSAYDGSSEENLSVYRPKMKKKVASLPLMPMKYQWGTPTASKNGKPDFSGGINDPNAFKPLPTKTIPRPTTTTTPRPLFPTSTLDKKSNLTAPSFQQSIIRLNKTHSVHVLQKKPYNPGKTRTRDAKGQPLSFSSVFTEIAGNTGGIHDFFDRISGAFAGEEVKVSGRELSDTFSGSNPDHPERYPQAQPTAFPPAPEVPLGEEVETPQTSSEGDKNDDDGSDEEDEDEDNDDEGSPENNDEEQNEEPNEENNDDDDEGSDEEDEEEEEDIADDLVEANPAENQKQKPKIPKHPSPPSPSSIESQISPFYGVVGEKQRPENNKKNKNPKNPAEAGAKEEEGEEEEDEEEEIEDDDEAAISNLPDTIPDFIKQSMVEDLKKKKKEQEQGGGQQGGQQGRPHPQQGGGRPGPGGRPPPPQQFGRPGQGPPPYQQQGQPPKKGGFFSSFFS